MQAGALGWQGEVFLLDMGEPIVPEYCPGAPVAALEGVSPSAAVQAMPGLVDALRTTPARPQEPAPAAVLEPARLR